jgi:hypothetical protein
VKFVFSFLHKLRKRLLILCTAARRSESKPPKLEQRDIDLVIIWHASSRFLFFGWCLLFLILIRSRFVFFALGWFFVNRWIFTWFLRFSWAGRLKVRLDAFIIVQTTFCA